MYRKNASNYQPVVNQLVTKHRQVFDPMFTLSLLNSAIEDTGSVQAAVDVVDSAAKDARLLMRSLRYEGF